MKLPVNYDMFFFGSSDQGKETGWEWHPVPVFFPHEIIILFPFPNFSRVNL